MLGEASDVLGRQGGGQLQKLVGKEQGRNCGVQPVGQRPGSLANKPDLSPPGGTPGPGVP